MSTNGMFGVFFTNRRDWTGWAVLAVLAAGFALRAFAAAVACHTTFDSGTVGLMAVNILKGDRPLFFYGQHYFGSLEAYGAALLFAVFGPSEFMLSMSPTLFSLAWIGATYLLFRELMGVRGGLAAALCVAVPSWVIVWFNVSSYGGYPCAFFLGTLALWLAVRIAEGDLSTPALWGHVLLLGLTAGLGLWTHYIVAAYLLTGAVVLLVFFIRRRFAPRVILPFVVGGLPFLAGLSPLFFGHAFTVRSSPVSEWQISWPRIVRRFLELADRPLRDHVLPPFDIPAPLGVAVVAVLCAAAALYVWRVATAARGERVRLLVPVLFVVIMLALYLPHRLADSKASRYTITLWSMMVCGAFAGAASLPRTALRRAAWTMLALWLVYYAACDVLEAIGKRAERSEVLGRRERVAAAAIRAGFPTVTLLGGAVFGYEGQALSFTADGKVQFVSLTDERYQPAAQAAEADPKGAIGCPAPLVPMAEAALRDLGVAYREIPDPWVALLGDFRVPAIRRRSVPRDEIRIEPLGPIKGKVASLTDRTRDTFVAGRYDGKAGLTLDLGRTRRIDSLWLCPPDDEQKDAPRAYELEIAGDDGLFHLVRRVACRTSSAYISGNQVYLSGAYGLMEIRFEPLDARRIRLRFTPLEAGPSLHWRIAEVYVFEDAGPGSPVSDAEVSALAHAVETNGVDFTVADRWLSARLLALLPSGPNGPPAYPRYNRKALESYISRFVIPRKGLAVAAPIEVAGECEALLKEHYGDAAVWRRIDFEHYALLVFDAPRGPLNLDRPLHLVWNGHTLWRTAGHSLPPWL